MQAAKSNRVHLGENLNPLKDAQGVESIILVQILII